MQTKLLSSIFYRQHKLLAKHNFSDRFANLSDCETPTENRSKTPISYWYSTMGIIGNLRNWKAFPEFRNRRAYFKILKKNIVVFKSPKPSLRSPSHLPPNKRPRMVPQPATMSIHAVESKFRAAAAEKKNIFSLSALAQLSADLGRKDEAVSLFEKALECEAIGSFSDETRSLAMGWYAALVEGDGKEGAEKAESLYKGALAINTQEPLAMGNYAVFLHRIQRDYRVSALIDLGRYRSPCNLLATPEM